MKGNTHNKNMITGQQKTVEWCVKEIVSVICIYDWLLFTSVVFLQNKRSYCHDPRPDWQWESSAMITRSIQWPVISSLLAYKSPVKSFFIKK